MGWKCRRHMWGQIQKSEETIPAPVDPVKNIKSVVEDNRLPE